MPLIKGKSKKSFDKNMETEMEAGKPRNQSLAIAYNMKKKAMPKMAHGGQVTKDGYQSASKGHTINIHVTPQAEPGPHRGNYADGGDVMNQLPAKRQEPLPEHEKMASGGMAGEQSESHDMDMIDRIMNKHMPSDEPVYMSKGGMLVNENSGESTSEPTYAKADPNEFDDLALRDDQEMSYTGANSGDEDGSKLNQDDDDEDMIGRIMKKRSAR